MAQLISCTVYPTGGGAIGTQLIGVSSIRRVYGTTNASNAAIVTAIELNPSGSRANLSTVYTNTAVGTILTNANA